MAEKEKIKVSKLSLRKARSVFRYIKPYAGSYAFSLVFLLLTSLTAMVFPFLMGKLINPSPATDVNHTALDTSDINAILLSLLIVFAAQSVFSFFRIFFGSRVVEGAMRDLRNDAYSKLVSMPMDFFNRNKVGELSSRISSDIVLLQETLSITITEFIRQIIIVIFGIIALGVLSFKLSLIMLAVIPATAIIAVFFGRFIKRLSKGVQDELAKSNQVIEESLTGIINVKSFANELLELRRYMAHTSNVHGMALKSAVWRGIFVSFIIFFIFGAIAFVVYQGVKLVNAGEMQLSDLISFILYTVFIGASFGSLPDLYAKILKTVGGTERLMELLEGQSEGVDVKNEKGKRVLTGKIEFKDVSFSYPTRPDVEVLNKISFSINPGEQMALVGSSGSGKSTIVSLVLQFYRNYTGKILFDDKDGKEIPLTHLRNHMALVPQEVILFSGTIRENIEYGRPGASFDEILSAARQANALDFIESFPEGFNTVVGDRGIQLSGGQKQRIAIARAVLKDPDILLLDEATSSLDSESEKIVQEALEKLMKGRTTIVIAHRLSTIRNANKIIVFQGGNIIEQGNHQQLMEKDGQYARLINLQSMTSPLKE